MKGASPVRPRSNGAECHPRESGDPTRPLLVRRALAALVAISLALSPDAVLAQGPAPDYDRGPAPISLPPLIQELIEKNPDIAAARKRWEAAQERIPLAKGLPPPRIGIEFEEIPRGTVRFDKATLMYQLIQSLPFPGKLSLRSQVALKEAQMFAAHFKQIEWEMLSMLKEVYYELFLLDRQLEIQNEVLLWLNQAASAAQAHYATGEISQAELLKVQGETLEASNRLKVVQYERKASEAHLNHLLNRHADFPVGPPAALGLILVPSTPKELFLKAKEHQPELLAFQFSTERAEAAWHLSKRELLPDLETMVELRDPAMGPIGPWDFTLALVLPFWFWTRKKYGVRAALFDRDSAAKAYEGMQNEIVRRIHAHWNRAKAAYETAWLCQEGLIPLAGQTVVSALAGYRANTGSFSELIEALRVYTERKRTYFEHLVMLEKEIVMLEQSVGLPLRPGHSEGSGQGDREKEVKR